MITGAKPKEKDFSKFDLGDYEEYYCGDKFYVLRPGNVVETLEPSSIPPSYCPKINYTHKKGANK
jgi:hypothetical protein